MLQQYLFAIRPPRPPALRFSDPVFLIDQRS
jgi:hypothetical protein